MTALLWLNEGDTTSTSLFLVLFQLVTLEFETVEEGRSLLSVMGRLQDCGTKHTLGWHDPGRLPLAETA